MDSSAWDYYKEFWAKKTAVFLTGVFSLWFACCSNFFIIDAMQLQDVTALDQAGFFVIFFVFFFVEIASLVALAIVRFDIKHPPTPPDANRKIPVFRGDKHIGDVDMGVDNGEKAD